MTGALPQVVGYTASALIVVSLTMKSLLRLRLFGLAGSVTFFAYGILIDAIPIVITNAVIMGIHVWFLRKLLRRTETFSLLRVRPESAYLGAFLDFHRVEIQHFQPGFEFTADEDTLISFILRDLLPAGLFIAHPHPDGSYEIRLDYAIPQYRDLKLGRWIYSGESGMFADVEPRSLWMAPWSDTHDTYLERMGFTRVNRDDAEVFELSG